jgi:hypothetical protein
MHPSRHAKLLVVCTFAALGVLGLTPAGASSANISHSYHSGEAVQDGSLVSLDAQGSSDVQPADTTNQARLFGVAVKSDDSLLAVNAGAENVQVATSGTASVLVSTLNGPIKIGDQVSASVGYVRVNIGLGTVAISSSGEKVTGVQKFAKSLTGHTVSTVRVVIAMILALIAFLALVTLIYASIYGGIVSIGRNPLAKYSILRSLISVLGMAAGMAGVTAVVVYLLLR